MAAVDSRQQRPPADGGAGSGDALRRSLTSSLRRRPGLTAVGACVILGIASAAILPTVPSYDPWSWIVWGREVSDPHLSFVVGGGPSWKPLPVIFTAIWGLFGNAAPTLWVITARIGGLLGIVAAWRLAARLTGGGWAGAFAGVLAVIGVLLTGRLDQDWWYYFLHGTSEVILTAAALWFVDRLLDGRHLQAFAIGCAAGLMRPEAWPFLGVYAIWLWLREPAFATLWMRGLLLAGLAAQPFFWFVPPWITTGDALLAAQHAADYNGHLGADVLRSIVTRGYRDQVVPALVGAVAAVIIGWVRDRNRAVLWIAAGVIAWWIVVVGETLDGYPGLERFFLPAAVLASVLGGAGIAMLAQVAGGLVSGLRRPVTVAAAAVLAALCLPFCTAQIAVARADESQARQAVHLLDQLSRAVAAVGGHRGVFPCHSSFAAINHSAQTALAFKLHVTLERVGTSMREPGLDFIGPHAPAIGGPALIDPRLTAAQTIAVVGPWRVVRLTDPNHVPPLPTACVGR
jgi:hypothetical protein